MIKKKQLPSNFPFSVSSPTNYHNKAVTSNSADSEVLPTSTRGEKSNPLPLPTDPYFRLRQINGRHPLQATLKEGEGYYSYSVRTKRNGQVLYFNFELAKEMGIIPANHPEKLNPQLEKTILEVFSITIINEYDIIHKTHISPETIHANKYMATRYLQLQHPSKRGKTSGDGRSIWNGIIEHNGRTYDISSCGTGATRLSPATAIQGVFFKTGDPNVSYGCGCAEVEDGLNAAILSEIFHQNNIPTERTLLVIEYQNGLSINVRAGLNLIRPSHFFAPLKQNNLSVCQRLLDYYIDREIKNGNLPPIPASSKALRYQAFLQKIIEDFASTISLFESEYIFCWIDWDGDNILTSGAGIIDYGSIRKFGLFHHKYRYDDVDRFSTTIVEQRKKARYIVQTFIQLVDFITAGSKQNIKLLGQHPLLKKFDELFEYKRREFLLHKVGFSSEQIQKLLKKHPSTVKKFQKSFSYFERQSSVKGVVKTADGIVQNAIFCMRDLLRELPKHLYFSSRILPCRIILQIMRSKYATKKDMRLSSYRFYHSYYLQKYYLRLMKYIATDERKELTSVLKEISYRSSIINHHEYITGNASIIMSEELMKKKKALNSNEFHLLIKEFIEKQKLDVPGEISKKVLDQIEILPSSFFNLGGHHSQDYKNWAFISIGGRPLPPASEHTNIKNRSVPIITKIMKKLLLIIHENKDGI